MDYRKSFFTSNLSLSHASHKTSLHTLNTMERLYQLLLQHRLEDIQTAVERAKNTRLDEACVNTGEFCTTEQIHSDVAEIIALISKSGYQHTRQEIITSPNHIIMRNTTLDQLPPDTMISVNVFFAPKCS